MPTTTLNHSDAASLPLAAFRAVRYADWTLPTWSRWPRRLTPYRTLPIVDHRRIVARASMQVALDRAPRWTMPDTYGQGAAAYRQAASAPPAWTPLQAAMLDAIRRMRRWSYYADAELDAAAPNQPLDGCHCRVCLERSAA